MLDRYLEAAADAVPATGETAGRGKSAGNTLAVREGLQRSQADGGQAQLSLRPCRNRCPSGHFLP